MADLAEFHALGQELAHQAVGILALAAPPQAVRVEEEDVPLQVVACQVRSGNGSSEDGRVPCDSL